MLSIASSMTRRNTGIALSLAMAVATAGLCRSANAALIASDSFNYTAGSNLVGQTGGSGWGSAWSEDTQGATAWTSTVGTTNGPPGTTATNLSYSTFGGTGDSGGGATVSASSVVSSSVGTLYRTFATPISTTTANTFWGSVEFKGQATIKFQDYYQLIFSDTPNTGGAATTTSGAADTFPLVNGSLHAIPLLGIGATPVNTNNSGSGSPLYFADSDGGAGVQLNTGTGDDNQHMFIFQIMTGVTDPANSNPAIEVITYADQSLANPAGWTAAATQFYDLSAAEQAGTITGVQYEGADQATTTSNRFLLMDEVKFGTTAQDVGAAAVTTPEPASLGVLAVGGLTLLARRRKA